MQVKVDRPLQVHEVCRDLVKDKRVEVHVVPQIDEKIRTVNIGGNCPLRSCCGSRSLADVREEAAGHYVVGGEAFSVGFSIDVACGVVLDVDAVDDSAACAARSDRSSHHFVIRYLVVPVSLPRAQIHCEVNPEGRAV